MGIPEVTISAAELGRQIDTGRLDPRDLTEHYLTGIESDTEAVRVFARLTAGRARAEASASAARARAGLRSGPLDGVPVAWKDLFDTAGVRTEAGSALLAGRVPDQDAVTVARASRAGLPCLGKTHMTELAFSGLGINPLTATPPGASGEGLSPGGSSSGSAAAVARGLAAMAIGSDTGGSVRVPAAWNGLVGLKTSHGSLPMGGVVPLCPRFDTIGPIGRSVEDCALVWSALAAEPPPDLSDVSLAGQRLAIADTKDLGPTDPAVAAALSSAVERIAKADARLAEEVFRPFKIVSDLAPCVYAAEAWGTWGQAISKASLDAMHPPVRSRFEAGADYAAHEYVSAWQSLGQMRRRYSNEASGFDAVLMPTTPNLPPKVAPLLADHNRFAEANLLTLRNTRIANLLGLCALTIPAGEVGVGIMVMAPAGSERGLLRIGRAVETALLR